MTRTLAVLATAAALGATTMAAPAQAHWHGAIGPGLAFGLAAGAITAGALAATSPWPGPAHYYGAGPYAYYGGPYYYRHHYWRHYW
jgi:hypothetical protein